jgi:prevent-host-death family protein
MTNEMATKGHSGKRRSIGIRELKNKATQIVSDVRERRSEYIVTKRGEPVAVVRPYTQQDADGAADTASERRALIERLEERASRVARMAKRKGTAGRESAAAAVSRQRR